MATIPSVGEVAGVSRHPDVPQIIFPVRSRLVKEVFVLSMSQMATIPLAVYAVLLSSYTAKLPLPL